MWRNLFRRCYRRFHGSTSDTLNANIGMGLFFIRNAFLSEAECRQVVWEAHVSDGHEGPTNADGSPEKGSAAYYASLVSSFCPQQERQDSGDEKAAIVNE